VKIVVLKLLFLQNLSPFFGKSNETGAKRGCKKDTIEKRVKSSANGVKS